MITVIKIVEINHNNPKTITENQTQAVFMTQNEHLSIKSTPLTQTIITNNHSPQDMEHHPKCIKVEPISTKPNSILIIIIINKDP